MSLCHGVPTPPQIDREVDGLQSDSVLGGRELDRGRNQIELARSVSRRAEQLVALKLPPMLFLRCDLVCDDDYLSVSEKK